MRTSQVAKKFNVSNDALLYWEKIGMIPTVPRDDSGYRNYTQNEIEWIDFVTCMRSSGVGVAYLVKYYQLFNQGESTKEDRQKLLEQQLNEMGQRIEKMQNAYSRLEEKLTHYDKNVEGMFSEKENIK